MNLHRYLADTELAGDLFVQQATDNEAHDLSFARREPVVPLAQLSHSLAMRASGGIQLDGRLHRTRQQVWNEWNCQEIQSPGLHRAHRQRDVRVAADEEHRGTLASQLLLQTEAAHIRQYNIEDQARRRIRPRAGSISRAGFKLECVQTVRRESLPNIATNANVATDNEHIPAPVNHGTVPSSVITYPPLPFSVTCTPGIPAMNARNDAGSSDRKVPVISCACNAGLRISMCWRL